MTCSVSRPHTPSLQACQIPAIALNWTYHPPSRPHQEPRPSSPKTPTATQRETGKATPAPSPAIAIPVNPPPTPKPSGPREAPRPSPTRRRPHAPTPHPHPRLNPVHSPGHRRGNLTPGSAVPANHPTTRPPDHQPSRLLSPAQIPLPPSNPLRPPRPGRQGRLPGANAEVRHRDARWTAQAGQADTTTGRERAPDDHFRGASITKTFIATVLPSRSRKGSPAWTTRSRSGCPGWCGATSTTPRRSRGGSCSTTPAGPPITPTTRSSPTGSPGRGSTRPSRT